VDDLLEGYGLEVTGSKAVHVVAIEHEGAKIDSRRVG
jgi:hypothetical protein